MKRYLKKWVEVIIIVIQILLFIILASECDNMKIFILSKLIVLPIFLFNHTILVKYSRLMED